jgi:CRISPR-associated protein Cas2
MKYLIAYDIADDRRRDRTANTLLDFARRIQHSVFVADIDHELAAHLMARLLESIDPLQDRLHMIPLCANCWGGMKTFGLAERPEDSDFYVL